MMMFLCESCPAARASRKKRSRSSVVLVDRGGDHLDGDDRSSSVSRARYTAPMPPWPSFSSSSYRPMVCMQGRPANRQARGNGG